MACVECVADREDIGPEPAELDSEIAKMNGKLGNAEFVRKAPEEVVDELRERREQENTSRAKLASALAQIKGAP